MAIVDMSLLNWHMAIVDMSLLNWHMAIVDMPLLKLAYGNSRHATPKTGIWQ